LAFYHWTKTKGNIFNVTFLYKKRFLILLRESKGKEGKWKNKKVFIFNVTHVTHVTAKKVAACAHG
jgi:hypothetical protein